MKDINPFNIEDILSIAKSKGIDLNDKQRYLSRCLLKLGKLSERVSNPCFKLKYDPGTIVFDKKNNEVSMVLNELDISLKDYSIMTGFSNSSNKTYVIVTEREYEEGLRIRYVKENQLVTLAKPKITTDPITDIDSFCKNQCFLECDKSCILYKYKNIKK